MSIRKFTEFAAALAFVFEDSDKAGALIELMMCSGSKWTEYVSITDLQTARTELADMIRVGEDQLPWPEACHEPRSGLCGTTYLARLADQSASRLACTKAERIRRTWATLLNPRRHKPVLDTSIHSGATQDEEAPNC